MATTTIKTSTTGNKYDPAYYEKMYNNAANNQKKAIQSAYDASVAQYNAQLPKIKEEYDTIRSDAYKNARLSAIGNNEQLAAQGLSGNLYSRPQSGYTETSRIAQDVAMRNDLNAANRQEQSQKDEIAQQILQAGYTKDINIANALAEIEMQKIPTLMQQNQYQQNFEYQAGRDAVADTQYAEQLAYQKNQDAITNALNEISTFGYVKTKASARALGVPVGTKSVTLKQLEGAFAKASGGSSSSRKKSSKKSGNKKKSGFTDTTLKNSKTIAPDGSVNGFYGRVTGNTDANAERAAMLKMQKK